MKVEIGPGDEKLGEDWVTVSAYPGLAVDHFCEWGMDRLPFEDGTVSLLYASHVFEHVPWTLAQGALVEAHRVLSRGGVIELHTIDFAKVVSARADGAEVDGAHPMRNLNYRLFNYPRVVGDRACVNWHHAAYDRDYLEHVLREAGFSGFEPVEEPRGPEKHAPWNLGIRGTKC